MDGDSATAAARRRGLAKTPSYRCARPGGCATACSRLPPARPAAGRRPPERRARGHPPASCSPTSTRSRRVHQRRCRAAYSARRVSYWVLEGDAKLTIGRGGVGAAGRLVPRPGMRQGSGNAAARPRRAISSLGRAVPAEPMVTSTLRTASLSTSAVRDQRQGGIGPANVGCVSASRQKQQATLKARPPRTNLSRRLRSSRASEALLRIAQSATQTASHRSTPGRGKEQSRLGQRGRRRIHARRMCPRRRRPACGRHAGSSTTRVKVAAAALELM
jgi:hypothetical protein